MNKFNAERFKAQLEKLRIKGTTENQPTLAADFSKFEYFSFLQAYNELVQFIYTLPVDDLEAIGEKLEELDTQIKSLTETVSTYTGKVDAALEDIDEFKTTINGQITNINTSITTLQTKVDDIGDLGFLETTATGTLVDAINELHTQNTFDRFYGVENGVLSDALGVGLQHWNQQNLPRHCDNSSTSQLPFDFGHGIRYVDFYNENAIFVNLIGNNATTNRAEIWRNYFNGTSWNNWSHFGLCRIDFIKELNISTGSFSIESSANYNYLILICNNTASYNNITLQMIYMSNEQFKITSSVFNGTDIYVVSSMTITRNNTNYTISNNDEIWFYINGTIEHKANQNRLYIKNVIGLTL